MTDFIHIVKFSYTWDLAKILEEIPREDVILIDIKTKTVICVLKDEAPRKEFIKFCNEHKFTLVSRQGTVNTFSWWDWALKPSPKYFSGIK